MKGIGLLGNRDEWGGVSLTGWHRYSDVVLSRLIDALKIVGRRVALI